MTDPRDHALGYEQPEADVLDQLREQGPDEPGLEPFGERPVEADEADLVEQHLVVPDDEDDV